MKAPEIRMITDVTPYVRLREYNELEVEAAMLSDENNRLKLEIEYLGKLDREHWDELEFLTTVIDAKRKLVSARIYLGRLIELKVVNENAYIQAWEIVRKALDDLYDDEDYIPTLHDRYSNYNEGPNIY